VCRGGPEVGGKKKEQDQTLFGETFFPLLSKAQKNAIKNREKFGIGFREKISRKFCRFFRLFFLTRYVYAKILLCV
jgi:hypothetical protein